MFNFLKKRLKWNMMIVVSIILLIHYFFIINMYFTIIKKDFSYKAEHFNKQYISNIESKMMAIENQIQIFLTKYSNTFLSGVGKYEINTATARNEAYTRIYQMFNPSYTPNTEIGVDRIYLDIPAADTVMFTQARKMLQEASSK